MKRNGHTEHMSVTDAVRATLGDLTAQEIKSVASACGYAVSTVYQWGEYRDDGPPRMRPPLDVVPAFCEVTRTRTLLDVVINETERRLRNKPMRDEPRVPTQPQVVAEGADVLQTLARALEDGVFTDAEHTAVYGHVRKFLTDLDNCPRSNAARVFDGRAATLAKTAGARG